MDSAMLFRICRLMVTVGQILALMDARRWSQQDLADACRVSQATVSRWLKGAIPKPAQQDRLLKLMGKQTVDQPLGELNEFLPALLQTLETVFESMGFPPDEAAVLAKSVVSIAQSSPTRSAGPDFHRILAEHEFRKFLKIKNDQAD